MEKGERGSTLIEVVVAVLLSAVMVASIFSVALTAKSEGKITEENITANQAVRQLSSQLHNYVTAYYTYASGFNSSMQEIPGPSQPGAPTMSGAQNQWEWGLVTMPGWTNPVADSCGGYILAVCTHTLQYYLPPWFESSPYNARISYTVSPPVSSSAGPGVLITTNWSTP